jgi:hypothetical protein
MTEETAPEVSGEDTAAVLSHAAGGEKTYLEPKEEAPQDEPTGTDAPAETEPKAEEPPPKKPTVQDRIDELTRARREAEREREYWRQEALKARPQEERKPAQADPDAEPNPEDFQYGEADPAYIRAITAHTTRQTIRQENERQRRATQEQAVAQTWQQRSADFAKDHPDFFERVYSDDVVITPAMTDAIATSEEGPRVAYHLAQNPDEARRIAALTPIAQVREIGRLESKLAQPVEAKPEPKTVSDAPPPAPQARGLRGQFKPPADTDDFAAFERAFVHGG